MAVRHCELAAPAAIRAIRWIDSDMLETDQTNFLTRFVHDSEGSFGFVFKPFERRTTRPVGPLGAGPLFEEIYARPRPAA